MGSKHAILSMSNIQDWVVQYDGLEEDYRKLLLENKEYKQDIHNLDCLNEKLEQDLQKMNSDRQLLPIFGKRLSSIQVELNETDREMEECYNQLRECKAKIKGLHFENEMLKQTNENCKQKIRQLEKIYVLQRDRPNNDHRIEILQRENKALRQELDLINAAINIQYNAAQSMTEFNDLTPLISPDDTIRRILSPRTPFNKMTNLEHIHNTFFSASRRTKSGSTKSFTDELMMKCEQLEVKNEELEKRLCALKNEKQCGCAGYNFIDETSSDELHEEESSEQMEDLFRKCDFEL